MSDTQNLHPSQRLVILRQTLGLTQRQLAKEFQVSNAAIACWEIGTRVIPGPVLKLIDLYERSLRIGETSSSESSANTMTDLKEHFSLGNSDDEQIVLNHLEQGFSSYVENSTALNSISGRLKQILIKRLLKSLTNTRGVSAKVAQLASFLEVGLPLEIRHALGTLQSRAEPLKPKTIRALLDEEYGTDSRKIFPYWRGEPLAVTSLGQVHYARLADGKEVAVKIQHPKIREILNSQMNKLEFAQSLAAFLGKKEDSILPEIRRALLQECDYRHEALNQEKFRNILDGDPRVIVPHVHRELVRDRVLVSEYINGKSFQNFSAQANQSERNSAAEIIMESLTKAAFGHRLVQSDWHPGNFLFAGNKVVLLDFGRIIEYPDERMRLESQFYMEFLTGQEKRAQIIARKLFAKDSHDFDYEDFWGFLKQSHLHLLIDEKFPFTRTHARSLTRQSQAYSKRHQVKMDKDAFWAMVFTTSTWGIFAEFEANINFRQIALNAAILGASQRLSP